LCFVRERREVHTGFWLGNLREGETLGRSRRRWEDNVNMDLQEVGCGGIDWIDLAQDRERWQAVVSAVMNLRIS
jgi:hypothetical protein